MKQLAHLLFLADRPSVLLQEGVLQVGWDAVAGMVRVEVAETARAK